MSNEFDAPTYDAPTFQKWKPLVEKATASYQKQRDLAIVLENTERDLREAHALTRSQMLLGETSSAIPANFMGTSSSTAGAGGIDTFDPILISMVRRLVPNLIAYDLCGVQPLKGPTGLIFAMRPRYTNQSGAESWYNEVNTAFSSVTGGANTLGDKNVGTLPGNTTQTSNLASTGLYNFAAAMATSQLEAMGTDSNSAFAEMAFTIEKVTATAKGRALAGSYTLEFAQDLRAIHGMDAEAEIASMLQTEILAEINREIIRTINVTAKQGAATDTTTAGVYDMDVDSNGRWLVEKFKSFYFFLDTEANQIAKETRRGKGNVMIVSSNLASALRAADVLHYDTKMTQNLQIDDTGATFAGMIGGLQGIKVYIDPYASGGDYCTIGYKGQDVRDAGLIYSPYVPLQMVRAVDQGSFDPKIGFKTRYAITANPFAQGATAGAGALVKDSNVFYRRLIVSHVR